MPPRNPYSELTPVPLFTLRSKDIATGTRMRSPQVSGLLGPGGGGDVSPHLAWSGFPTPTQSFVVTVYDPMAPTGSGFWHWAVVDIPRSVHELPTGAGAEGEGQLPPGACQLRNDAGLRRYVGAVPHRGRRSAYFTAVHAVDVPSLGLSPDSTCAMLGLALAEHTLARAVLIPWFELAPELV